MPYEPLHHKYRPQTFAELVGQESVTTTLTNALRYQRIAPAYLFTGARGTGKTSSARILAKSLNCLASSVPTEVPCGKCEVCRMIANGSALDVIEIDAASNTGVDNIRELIERAQFAPVQCRYKVYVVDECHMLSTAAFNALLKTLEEPPDRVVFVLATTDPQRVLPTIISRCQRFDFRRIPPEAMVQHLGKIADQEAIDITPEALQLVAQIAQGGLRDAESLLDQLSLLEGQITAEKVWDLVGAVPERDLLALVQAIAADESTLVIDRARHLMDRGREPLIVLQNLASFYRDLLIAKTSPDRPDLIAVTSATWTEMCKFAQDLPIPTILRGQKHLRESEAQVKNTTQPRLWLEVTLMGLLPSALQPGAIQVQSPEGGEQQARRSSLPPISPPVLQEMLQPQVKKRSSPAPAKNASVKDGATLIPSQSESVVQPEVNRESVAAETTTETTSETTTETALEAIEPPIESIAIEPPESQSVEPIQSAQPDNSFDLEQVWETVIAQIKFRGTQVLLQQQALLLAFNGREARIGIKSQPLFQMAKKQVSNIETAFEAVYQQKVRVSLEVSIPPASSSGNNSGNSPRNNSAAPPNGVTSPPPLSSVSASAPPPPTAREFSAPLSPVKPITRPTSSLPLPAVEVAVSSPEPGEVPELAASAVWQEDEVKEAARSVAQFFNGEIVSLEDDTSIALPADALTPTTDLDEVDGDPDEDVPF
jgi:DNA polymerase-3 subunit gamma/tau